MSRRRVESAMVEFDTLETSVMTLRCLLDYFVTAVLYYTASGLRNGQGFFKIKLSCNEIEVDM